MQQSDAAVRPAGPQAARKPRKRRSSGAAAAAAADVVSADGVHDGRLVPKSADDAETSVVALDCEMVGVGSLDVKSAGRDALARVCVVCCFPSTAPRTPSFRWPASSCVHAWYP